MKKLLSITFAALIICVFNVKLFACECKCNIVELTFLQLNDVYELTPVSGGKLGGLARVGTLIKQLKEENPNTFSVLAGDLFSPSALGTSEIDGKRLAGEHIVNVFNELQWNFMTFGNHEFDLKRHQFYERLSEAKFSIFTSNVFDENDKFLPGVEEIITFTVRDKMENPVKVALIGLTLNGLSSSYVKIHDPVETAKREVAALRGLVDIIILVTHLPLSEDMKIAESVPGVDLIIGGHEHNNIRALRGANFTPVCKADANAKTAYIHRLQYDTASRKLNIKSELLTINEEIAEDPYINSVVEKWLDIGFKGFEELGFNPRGKVATVTEPLDGLETSVRFKSTRLTELIASSMLSAGNDVDAAIFNSGSVRIDDIIPPGLITEYDILRIMPFGGLVKIVKIKGDLLEKVLTIGLQNRGSGGFLQFANIKQDGSVWKVQEVPIKGYVRYTVAVSDFLLTGKETNLGFLKDNPDIEVIRGKETDIRKAFIAELKKVYGNR